VIQYSRDADDRAAKPQRTGYSAFAEYDGGRNGNGGNNLDDKDGKTAKK
jgi:hypothetical protein